MKKGEDISNMRMLNLRLVNILQKNKLKIWGYLYIRQKSFISVSNKNYLEFISLLKVNIL